MTVDAPPIVCAGCGAYVFGNGGNRAVPQHEPHKPGCKQADVMWPRSKPA